MMTIAQKKDVLNFLISKKLPVDLITELNDHFNEQITEQISKNNLTFEEGFLKVKLIWEDDFKLEKSGFLSFTKQPKIAVKYQQQQNNWFIKQSLGIAMFLILTNLASTKIFQEEYYFIFNLVIYTVVNIALPFTIVLMYIILNFKRITSKRISLNYKARIPVLASVIIVFVMSRHIDFSQNSFKILFDFMSEGKGDFQIFSLNILKNVITTFTYIYLYKIMNRRWKDGVNFKKLLVQYDR